MGDFHIPGAPFLVSVPDDWNVVISTTDSGGTCIEAVSPQETTKAVYHIFNANSIDEVLADPTPKIIAYHPVDLRFTANGMDCLLYNGLATHDLMAVYLWETAPNFQQAVDMPNVFDQTVAFVENQGVVLRITINMDLSPDEFSEHPALLLISGVHPYSPTLAPDEDPFEATTVSPLDPYRQSTLPTKPITHKGVRLTKSTPKKGEFKALLDLLAQQKPQIWVLNRLKAISDTLRNHREYGDFSKDLDTIREMLKKQWGISDTIEEAIESRDPKSHTDPPVSPADKEAKAPPPTPTIKERESTPSCMKCGTPLEESYKFCRECGTPTTTKPKRWSPSS